jgi:hypothetical protein
MALTVKSTAPTMVPITAGDRAAAGCAIHGSVWWMQSVTQLWSPLPQVKCTQWGCHKWQSPSEYGAKDWEWRYLLFCDQQV